MPERPNAGPITSQLDRRVVDFLFAEVPGTPGLLFVEVETQDGFSVNVGQWLQPTTDQYHRLRVVLEHPPHEPQDAA